MGNFKIVYRDMPNVHSQIMFKSVYIRVYILIDVCHMLSIIDVILWLLLLYLSATHCD